MMCLQVKGRSPPDRAGTGDIHISGYSMRRGRIHVAEEKNYAKVTAVP